MRTESSEGRAIGNGSVDDPRKSGHRLHAVNPAFGIGYPLPNVAIHVPRCAHTGESSELYSAFLLAERVSLGGEAGITD